MNHQCKYQVAWIGQCKKESVPLLDCCAKHAYIICQCGEKAIKECAETMYGFVCGVDICDTCEHLLDQNGCNSSSLRHVKPEHQIYLSWWLNSIYM